MTSADKKQLKAKISKELTDLEASIKDLKELTKPIAPENSIGRVSRMDAINNKSVNEAALRQAELKMSKLQIAMVKIDLPTYGKCKACAEQIPLPRLMYMPESSHCVKCAR